MPLTWTEELSVGFGRIDEQHQQLFARYHDLFDACTTGKGRDAIAPMLEFLTAYVEEHFAEEERYMTGYAYPEREAHIQQHRELFARIDGLRRELAVSGPSAALVITLTHSLIHWLVSHVKHVDVKLGRFLSERVA